MEPNAWIALGGIVLTGGGSVLAVYMNLERKIAVLETKVEAHEDVVSEVKDRLDNQAAKLDRLLEMVAKLSA
jgi:uncharacterized coiled-coil protein SlyX